MDHPDFDSKEQVQQKWADIDTDHIQSVLQRPTTELTIKTIEQQADISKSDRVLEVGCGWGRLITNIEGTEQKFVVDISPDMLRKQEYLFGDQINKTIGDGDSLPFKSNTFDVVYSVRVLQYVTDVNHTISEMKRVLNDDGTLVIILPNKYNLYNYMTYHTKLYWPSEIRAAFERNGFADISIEYFTYSPPDKFVEELEVLSSLPIVRKLGGLYVVTGTA